MTCSITDCPAKLLETGDNLTSRKERQFGKKIENNNNNVLFFHLQSWRSFQRKHYSMPPTESGRESVCEREEERGGEDWSRLSHAWKQESQWFVQNRAACGEVTQWKDQRSRLAARLWGSNNHKQLLRRTDKQEKSDQRRSPPGEATAASHRPVTTSLIDLQLWLQSPRPALGTLWLLLVFTVKQANGRLRDRVTVRNQVCTEVRSKHVKILKLWLSTNRRKH